MAFVAGDKGAELRAEFVVRIGGYVMEFIDSEQAAIEGFRPVLLNSKAEGGVSADEDAVVAFEESLDGFDFAAVFARRIAEVPARRDLPVCPKTKLAQGDVVKAGADGFFRDDDDGFFQALMVQFVEGDEHQCAAFAGSGR